MKTKRLFVGIVLLCAGLSAPAAAGETAPDDPAGVEAVLKTDYGDLVVRFHAAEAPAHAAHFLKLAREGSYDGTTFFRLYKNGVIMGGDPNTKDPAKAETYGEGGFGDLKAEIGALRCIRGSVVAMTLPDQPDTGGSQFFICLGPQPQMDGKYTVFGQVAAGMRVADRIGAAPVDERKRATERIVLRKIEVRPVSRPAFAKAAVEEMKSWHAVVETSLGDFEIAFWPDKAPEHVRALLSYMKAGLYDGCDFHRVVPGFCIQGGLLPRRSTPPDEIAESWVHPLKREFNDTVHEKGIVSMARTPDPDSALTSFFVCLGPQPHLDGQYTAFGRVVSGMETVEKIAAVACEGSEPKTRVEIKSIKLKKVPEDGK